MRKYKDTVLMKMKSKVRPDNIKPNFLNTWLIHLKNVPDNTSTWTNQAIFQLFN